ncbi:DUF4910 domain-containing protein [Paenibacillus sp. LMG 31461]|uniref:DUF4910 domain-containing protein n=2 Tax=Paenibacillus plantarum TaxID=2654975 RepID=A0ABX1XFL6_9BACL|nr:DUF4910 domain-containing protein [Paenibacillus plantarum]
MDQLFDRLFPICRSITGPGVRETLAILQEYIPLQVEAVSTGTVVYDWQIPKEWRIRDAWIKDSEGNKIVDFKENNLHVLNYSVPVDQTMTLDELKSNLYSLPHLPDAIPYVTSYYKERWGFCLSQRQLEGLQPGNYQVYIDSEHVHGELNYGHLVLPGENTEEVLISSYICHPSMANNELSGPIVAAFLYNRIKSWPKRRFTYRFVLAPETIGAVAYLHQNGKDLLENLHAGLVLTCLGGEATLSFKGTRRGNTDLDVLIQHLFHNQIPGRTRPFTPIHGSDERQYGSPGFNLPVGQITRVLHDGYIGYHNSMDTKEAMGIDSLQRSVNELETILHSLELQGHYINLNPYGEVKLDKHELYPDFNFIGLWGHSNNQVVDHRTQLNRILTMLNYADGQHSLLQIADKCGCSVLELEPVLQILLEKQLIKGPFTEKRGLFE